MPSSGLHIRDVRFVSMTIVDISQYLLRAKRLSGTDGRDDLFGEGTTVGNVFQGRSR